MILFGFVTCPGIARDGRPVLLGVTERPRVGRCVFPRPGPEVLSRPWFALKGVRIRLVTDRPMEAVEVHPASANSVDMTGVTVEYYPSRPAMG